jgi:monofunctional biosynthetic peptidoglycan transglycosylase
MERCRISDVGNGQLLPRVYRIFTIHVIKAEPQKVKISGIRRVIHAVKRLTFKLFLASILAVLIFRFLNPPITPLMLIRKVESAFNGKTVRIQKSWRTTDEISPSMLRAVIAAEDFRFLEHNGVDWETIKVAMEHNKKSGGKDIRGGSTITMQCARNVFLWQSRNYFRKSLEVYFTYLMEFLWSKERILEVYLNVAEWGDGIYGIDSAAMTYFGIQASDLNLQQAALLASILPNPRKFSPIDPSPSLSHRASLIEAYSAAINLERLK